MTTYSIRLWMGVLAFSTMLTADGLDPALLRKPATDSWPTYNGDYSGRRFSVLDQINRSNVNELTLAWTAPLTENTTGNVGGEHKDGEPYYWGGPSAQARIAASPLMVNGVIYLSAPDHAWAIDAYTGREIWQYHWNTLGGIHIGNRGMAMYANWLFFETPDCFLVSLDATTGKERWHKQIADVRQQYFCTPAPVTVGNHIIAGMGGDSLDVQGSLQSFDPETGDLQWKWYTTPQHPGEPGYDSWPDDYSRTHGGGMPWQPITYDPDLNLVYVSTGGANPTFNGKSRKGDNLYANSLVALNGDTGKMVWYFQLTPHDTWDWDNTQNPILFDGEFKGQQRKMVGIAASNGYFFLLDRTNGKNLITAPFTDLHNWNLGTDAKGQLIHNPAKDPSVGGTLIAPGKATNWPPSTYDPQTGLFYVGMAQGYNILYISDNSERPEGYAGIGSGQGPYGNVGGIRAIDYRTGKIRWEHPLPSNGVQGLLSTAGHLLFGGDKAGNFVAYDVDTGKALWHTAINPSNPPITYLLDGRQMILVASGDTLYALMLSR
jgi:alcohol dehydrogenase (cytochrome c)